MGEQALARAAEAAKKYVRKTSSIAEECVRKVRKTKIRRIRAELAVKFETIQSNFLRKHKERIMENSRTVMGNPISLLPVPLAYEVQQRFMESYRKSPGSIIPVLHGTNECNKESIFSRGLLIPSAENGLKVAHGSAHGLGIYAADLSNPQTAMCYSSDRHLLVCAMLVKRDDALIKSGSGFSVVFDHCRIAPLFEVSGQGLPTKTRCIPEAKSVTRRKMMKAGESNRNRSDVVRF